MLQATQQLLQRKDAFASSGELRTAYVSVVAAHGSLEDAQALMPLYLSDPGHHWELLDIFMAHGDLAIAKALFDDYLIREKQSPIESLDCEALHCIGYLGLQEAADYLWGKSKEFCTSGAPCATLGLLDLDCSSFKDEIAAEIRSHKGKNLFPEFVPALAYKSGDRELLSELFAWGNGDLPQGQASSDCNGGLVLGVALFGAEGKPLFHKLLWSEEWGSGDVGTGTAHYTYLGIRVLELKFRDLLEELKTLQDADDAPYFQYRISVLIKLLEMHAKKYWRPQLKICQPPAETLEELLALTCYDFEAKENTLLDLATDRLGCSSGPVESIHNLRDVFSVLIAKDLERTELLARKA